uniref:Uncharacterized protein n=1 Tax=Leersia perrieri TaxID=77586 RepID=A0A0D9XRH2_9ORYZ
MIAMVVAPSLPRHYPALASFSRRCSGVGPLTCPFTIGFRACPAPFGCRVHHPQVKDNSNTHLDPRNAR